METQKRGRGRPKIDTSLMDDQLSRRAAVNAKYMYDGMVLIKAAATEIPDWQMLWDEDRTARTAKSKNGILEQLGRMAEQDRFHPDDCVYRTVTSRGRDRELLPASQINSSLTQLLRSYESQTETDLYEILDFHVNFEQIFPFEDGNGRMGRLLMFKECLRQGVIPFIIDDKRRSRYLRGIREWDEDRYELKDVVLEAQDRFEAQLELKRLSEHGYQFLPEDYEVE